jgi:hypothetical protein
MRKLLAKNDIFDDWDPFDSESDVDSEPKSESADDMAEPYEEYEQPTTGTAAIPIPGRTSMEALDKFANIGFGTYVSRQDMDMSFKAQQQRMKEQRARNMDRF